MATQIHALSFKATVDSRQLKEGMTATRAEFRKASAIANEYESAQDKLNRGFWELDSLLHKGLITEKQFNAEMRKGISETKKLERETLKLARSRTVLGKAQNFLAGKISSGAMGIAGGLAAGLGARAAVGNVSRQITEIDALNKTAKKLAVPIEYLSRLSYVTSAQAGMTAEQTGKALSVMSKQISESSRGMGDGQKALESLGLSAEALNSQSMDKKFAAIAQAVKGIGSEADQLAIIQKIFGEEGGGMANVLRMSNSELTVMLAKAQELGAVVTQVEADKISEAAQQWADASVAWSAAWRDVTVVTAPVAGWISEDVRALRSTIEALKNGRTLAEQMKQEAFDRGGGRANKTGNFANTSEAELDRLLAEQAANNPRIYGNRIKGDKLPEVDKLTTQIQIMNQRLTEMNSMARNGQTTKEPRTITD